MIKMYNNMNQNCNILKVGRVGEGKSQSKTVFLIDGISPTLTASMGDKGNTMPYIIIDENGKETKEE